MRKTFRLRPWRMVYALMVTAFSVQAFGWWVLLPLVLISIEIEVS